MFIEIIRLLFDVLLFLLFLVGESVRDRFTRRLDERKVSPLLLSTLCLHVAVVVVVIVAVVVPFRLRWRKKEKESEEERTALKLTVLDGETEKREPLVLLLIGIAVFLKKCNVLTILEISWKDRSPRNSRKRERERGGMISSTLSNFSLVSQKGFFSVRTGQCGDTRFLRAEYAVNSRFIFSPRSVFSVLIFHWTRRKDTKGSSIHTNMNYSVSLTFKSYISRRE